MRSTDDFERLAEHASGKNLTWFFDAYFRTAALPKLVATREGTTLHLAWQTEAAEPFILPVEVELGDGLVTVAMPGGQGSLKLPSAETHVALDPRAKILRDDPAITAWQAQEEARRKQESAAKAGASQ
jgi:aminopeptidase N